MTNTELVESLINQGFLKSKKVIKAFLKVDRADFVPKKYQRYAYLDMPLDIGHGATISQPLVVAFMTEALDVIDGQKIFEIGAGSGYQAAILAEINKTGKIFTIEVHPEVAVFAKENLQKYGYKNVELIVGDGRHGLPKHAPFDRIIITCACDIIYDKWKEELMEGGKIIAPVGLGFVQDLILGVKEKGKVIESNLNFPCAFVRLRS